MRVATPDAKVQATQRSRAREYVTLDDVHQLRANGWPFPHDVQRALLAECPSARQVLELVDRRAALTALIDAEYALAGAASVAADQLVGRLTGDGPGNDAVF